MSTTEATTPTTLGDYCTRCGAQTVIVAGPEGEQNWTCPRGCGIMRTVAAQQQPTPGAEKQAKEESSKKAGSKSVNDQEGAGKGQPDEYEDEEEYENKYGKKK